MVTRLELVLLPLRWASTALAGCMLPVAAAAVTSHLLPRTAIWAQGLGEGPASHLPAWSLLLLKGSGVPVGAGAHGGGSEAVLWPGQPVRPQAAGPPQSPALVLLPHTTQGPGLSEVLASTRTAVQPPWFQVLHLYMGKPNSGASGSCPVSADLGPGSDWGKCLG